ncbi:DUF6801 domain-containing protein [Branchiibius sp. NY16-3462-2]|uniref:DUF6801 domain-containing protein n=1 Tax=Branchiibius sp. NY16-3462-2 TaxID=1807500 RepID=UPI000797E79D|nr:DUF6801 domain-containing protein [Branchiibius sp. NY16-3462-2]KYH43514.1 hypothetical protein AZH51_17355 [Branchiibius sp. NY16-3462-2]
MTTTISRRTLAKGAAWSVPVVAVAAAAPTASASPADCISSGTLSNSTSGVPATPNYACVQTDEAGNPTGTGLGNWRVQIIVATCTAVHAGSTLKTPPQITANVITSTTAGNVLRGFGAETVTGGTSAAGYTATGQVLNSGATRTGNLNIGTFPVPASGGITTTATGTGSLETSTTAGTINIAAGDFTVVLNWTGSDPDTGAPNKGTNYIKCTTGTSTAPATSVPLTPAITVQ